MVTGEFDVEILRDLIAEGYESQELLKKFSAAYEKIHSRVAGFMSVIDVKSDFDVEILRDLIAEGYEGQELLNKFVEFREKIPVALKDMFDDIIARSGGKTYTLEECFS